MELHAFNLNLNIFFLTTIKLIADIMYIKIYITKMKKIYT